jgi:glycosyltransferase involved in cell wall biosynthesis
VRITYLHQYFNTPEMAGGTRSYEMARRLVDRGHDVSMITSWRARDRQKGWFVTDESGIQVHWLSLAYSNYMSYAQRIRAFWQFALRAAGRAASFPADVIFATSTPLTIALPGAYAAWRRRVPMVFEVRDLWPELPIAMGALNNPVAQVAARSLERFAYRRSDHVVALSPGMKEGVTRCGYPGEQVSVIPNSCDLALFDPQSQKAGQFRAGRPELGDGPMVVYAGTMGIINGVSYVPRIAAAARDQGSAIQFVVVGEGKEDQLVRDEGRRLGVLGDNFHVYYALPKSEIPGLLADTDVALSLFIDLRAMWANSANKFFDALASGTPVAINYGGWQAQLLEESGAGLILPANEPDEAACLLDRFVTDREAVHRAGIAARDMAQRRFSRDELAGQLENVLLGVVSQTSA